MSFRRVSAVATYDISGYELQHACLSPIWVKWSPITFKYSLRNQIESCVAQQHSARALEERLQLDVVCVLLHRCLWAPLGCKQGRIVASPQDSLEPLP